MKMKVRKTLILVSVSSLLVTSNQASLASTQISKSQVQHAVSSIKSSIVKANGDITALKLGKENSLAEALTIAALATKKVQDTYDQKKNAQLEKKSNALVRLNDLSVFRVTVDNISACGANFQTHCEKNQTIKVPTSSSLDVSFLIRLGGFVPLDEVSYQDALKTIKEIDAEILKLDSYLPGDKTNIENQYKSDAGSIYKDFDLRISEKETDIDMLKKSKLAADRALKSGGNYQDTFSNAVLFEINLENITAVADTSFQNIDSLLDLSVVRNAVTLSNQGETIKGSYSAAKAKKYNKIFGNTFLDSYSKEIIDKTSAIFKKFAK
jgi:hypothetical protein